MTAPGPQAIFDRPIFGRPIFERHGGRLRAAQARYPDAPRPWIDLSTGINPHPYPATTPDLAARSRLPDPDETARLEAVAAEAFGLDGSRIAAVPGSEVAVGLLPHLLGVGSVAIGGPTYASHAAAWRAADAVVTEVTRDEIDSAAADAVVLVNPNNPDGRQTAKDRVLAMARERAERSGWLIIDEAFTDVAPDISVAGEALANLIVLRSFGKFYGLAGVRLGFVIADRPIIAKIRATLGDWPVSADAIAAGIAAYADRAWAHETRTRLARDAARLDRALVGVGLEIVGGTSLFRLARCADAERRFTRLAAGGILTRIFDADPSLIRFGIPGNGDWARVDDSLARSAG